MALKIDEEWIRERVHLEHDNLDDVKSLSLPGSYHEKISLLGTSLHSFTRLKHLDLSRNSVCNLEGIGHLQVLETLNLYYNNISTLKDLYHLRTLTNLKELDIRLNPVTKNEPDHRLFLIHMLPSLKKLDDRSVRDSERKAALMHFNTDQASEFTDDRFQDDFTTNNERFSVPRAELVRKLGPRSALNSDDVLLLDTINRPSYRSGSGTKYREAQDYPRQELAKMHIVAEEKPVAREARKNPSAHHPRSLGVDVNLNIRPASHPPVNISQRCAPPDLPYVPHGAQGNFTPSPRPKPRHPTAEHGSDVPEDSAHSDSVVQGTGRQRYKDEAPGLDEQRVLRRARDTDSSSSSGSHPIADQSHPSNTANNELRLLHKLVDLVDKYWNGSKSLHNHPKFKELAIDVLKTYQPSPERPERDVTSMKKLRQEVLTKEEQLDRLFNQLKQQEKECSLIKAQLVKDKEKHRKSVEETSQELTTLHIRFQEIQEENQNLKSKLESQKDTDYEKQKKSEIGLFPLSTGRYFKRRKANDHAWQ